MIVINGGGGVGNIAALEARHRVLVAHREALQRRLDSLRAQLAAEERARAEAVARAKAEAAARAKAEAVRAEAVRAEAARVAAEVARLTGLIRAEEALIARLYEQINAVIAQLRAFGINVGAMATTSPAVSSPLVVR